MLQVDLGFTSAALVVSRMANRRQELVARIPKYFFFGYVQAFLYNPNSTGTVYAGAYLDFGSRHSLSIAGALLHQSLRTEEMDCNFLPVLRPARNPRSSSLISLAQVLECSACLLLLDLV